jgi:hypothetical protein
MVAYTQQPDYDTLREVNVPLMKRAVEAIDALSPALEHVILQTGGKVRPGRIMGIGSDCRHME